MSISKSQLDAINSGILDTLGEPNTPDLNEGNVLERALMNIAQKLSDDLKAEARKKGVTASRSLIQSIKPIPSQTSASAVEVSIVMEDHWRYANYGRKRGKRPPIKSIEEWITEKGLIKAGRDRSGRTPLQQRRSLAFAIAAKIGSKGTIKRFQYKGSKFIESVLTRENVKRIAEHLAELQGRKIELYFEVLP